MHVAGVALLVDVFVVLVDVAVDVASGARTTGTLLVLVVSDCHVSEITALPLLGTTNE